MPLEERTPTADELQSLRTGELLALSRLILAELRRREVIRSGNAPAGDYAELLVQLATGGELAPASQKSWDVRTPEGETLQVKARVVTDPRSAGERQLSVFRSWGFDAALIVLFDDQFGPPPFRWTRLIRWFCLSRCSSFRIRRATGSRALSAA